LLIAAITPFAFATKGKIMADVTAQEAQQIRDAFAEAGRVEFMPDITVTGTKEAFCDSWPKVKDVLSFLQEFAPQPIKGAIGVVIKVGDKLYNGSLCQAQRG
jgi:hypothetical protein